MSYIDSTGFVKTRLPEIQARLRIGFKSIYGLSDAAVAPETKDGQIIDLFALIESENQDLAEAVFNGLGPAADGVMLNNVLGLNGLIRGEGGYSAFSAPVHGDAGTIIPNGSLVGISTQPDVRLRTVSAVQLDAGGDSTVTLSAQDKGPITFDANTDALTIMSVIKGWASVGGSAGNTNVLQLVTGSLYETAGAARSRRSASVAAPSQSMLDGLVGELLGLAGVSQVMVYEKKGTDGDQDDWVIDGTTYEHIHGIWCIVQGGDEDEIAEVIWRRSGQGVQIVGAELVSITDSVGFAHAIRYSVPDSKPIHLGMSIVNAPMTASETKTAIVNALTSWQTERSFSTGKPLSWVQVLGAIRDRLPTLDIRKFAMSGTAIAAYPAALPAPADVSQATMTKTGLPGWSATNIRIDTETA
jgi:hypothetical protein